MALITAAQVIATTPIHKNLDTANIERMIEPTQLSDLLYVLGSGFYNEIVSSGWMVDGVTLSGLDSTSSGLMANYIKPFMEWQVAVSVIPFMQTSVANNGLFSGVPRQTQKATAPEKHNIESRLQQSATVYKKRLIDYLEANRDSFPTWRDAMYSCEKKSGVFKTFGII